MKRIFYQRNIDKYRSLMSLYGIVLIICWLTASFLIDPIAMDLGSQGSLLMPLNQARISSVAMFAVIFIELAAAGIFAYCAYWLYYRGAPLWIAGIAVFLFAVVVPVIYFDSFSALQLLFVALLLWITLKFVDAMRDHYLGIRKGHVLYILMLGMTGLMLISLLAAFITTPIMLALIAVPSKARLKVLLLSLAALVLTAIIYVEVFQSQGMAYIVGEQISKIAMEISPNFGHVFSASFDLSGLVASLTGSFRWYFWLGLGVDFLLIAALWFFIGTSSRYLHILVIFVLLYLSLSFVHNGSIVPLEGARYSSIYHAMAVFECFALVVVGYIALLPYIYKFSETKTEQRSRVLATRKTIPSAERQLRSRQACDQLLQMLQTIDPAAGYVALYAAMGSEVSLNDFQAKAALLGYRLAYPVRISDTDIKFVTTLGVSDSDLLAIISAEDIFATKSNGSAFPNADATGKLPAVTKEAIAVMIMPCVAVDELNNRLGYGKGCYDRYLQDMNKKVPRWLVAFSEQVVNSVPCEPHDMPVHARVVV